MRNRREFLFLYDVSWANPNGDPMDENKPRIDEETGINYVTPDRFKRTIRDTLVVMGETVFLREIRKEDLTLLDKSDILKQYFDGKIDNVIKQAIDIRLFGGTFAIDTGKKKKSSEEETTERARGITGPVQFKFGRSLHRVKPVLVKGSSVMPSEGQKDKTRGSLPERWVVPYALIVFYGIANEAASVFRNEKGEVIAELSDDDIFKMLKAIWIGHKSSTDVISYSKFGHEPRLLIEIIYKERTLTHMGELDKLVSINTDKREEEIRDIEEVEIDLSKLKEKVKKYKDKIKKVRYKLGDRVRLREGIESVFEGVEVEELDFEGA